MPVRGREDRLNAVNDALRPFGVVADRQPLSPDYIKALLRGKG